MRPGPRPARRNRQWRVSATGSTRSPRKGDPNVGPIEGEDFLVCCEALHHDPSSAILDRMREFGAEALVGGRAAVTKGCEAVGAGIKQTRGFLRVVIGEVGAVQETGGRLKKAFERTHATHSTACLSTSHGCGTNCAESSAPPPGRRSAIRKSGTSSTVTDGAVTGTLRPGTALRRAAETIHPAPVRVVELDVIDGTGALPEALSARPGEVWVIRPDASVALVLTGPGTRELPQALRRSLSGRSIREDRSTREVDEDGVLPANR